MAGIAETARLVSSLELNTKKFDAGVSSSLSSLGKLSSGIAKSRAVAVGLGVGLERVAEKGLSALGGAIADGIQGALTLEKAQAQTQAVITSTGAAAGVTAGQVRDMANALEDVTTVDDKTIQQGENLLLTFTNIGKTVFPQATKAAVDMAIAFNKGDAATADIDGAAIQLGKALNDPATGFTALKKAGVSFSEAQIKILKGTNGLTKEEVKHYLQLKKRSKQDAERYIAGVKAAKLLASQKLILAELEKEFGKAGAAAGTGFAADITRANDAIDDAKISIAQGLIPAVGEVAVELKKTLSDPAVQTGLKNLGVGIGHLITDAVAFAKTVPWDKIASSLQAAAGFAKNLLDAFLGLPTWVQTAVVTGWGLNKITGGLITDLASGLIKGVLGMTAGVVNLTAGTVIGGGGVTDIAADVATKGGLLAIIGTAGIIAAAAVGSAYAFSQLHTGADSPGSFTPNLGAAFDAKPVNPNDFRGIDWETIAHGLNASTGAKSADIEHMRASIIAGIDGLPAKTVAQANAIQTAAAQRDAENSTQIQTLIAAQDTIAQTTDIETAQAKTTAVINALDTTTYTAGSVTSQAARQAGQAASSAAYGAGAGIEQAIRENRPITNVNVEISAVDVTRVNVTEDRGGSRSGSRDGDGGGGPGQ